MAKKMSKGGRRYLVALVDGLVCERCRSAPAAKGIGRFHFHVECAPCRVKRLSTSGRKERV